jgi:hypothetical protein
MIRRRKRSCSCFHLQFNPGQRNADLSCSAFRSRTSLFTLSTGSPLLRPPSTAYKTSSDCLVNELPFLLEDYQRIATVPCLSSTKPSLLSPLAARSTLSSVLTTIPLFLRFLSRQWPLPPLATSLLYPPPRRECQPDQSSEMTPASTSPFRLQQSITPSTSPNLPNSPSNPSSNNANNPSSLLLEFRLHLSLILLVDALTHRRLAQSRPFGSSIEIVCFPSSADCSTFLSCVHMYLVADLSQCTSFLVSTRPSLTTPRPPSSDVKSSEWRRRRSSRPSALRRRMTSR